ncbi:MAG TPA: hypothetical protein VH440_06850 [Candidatus Limnocylindrales bacterium]
MTTKQPESETEPGPGPDVPRPDPGAPRPEPGEPRQRLDRPPGERYASPAGDADTGPDLRWAPVAVVLSGAILYTVLGGILTITAGLVVLAAFIGWLIGKLVSPPPRAALVGLLAVVAGLLGIWLFGRVEGGVLDPITYLDEVQGWPLVIGQLLAGAGLAAAASR